MARRTCRLWLTAPAFYTVARRWRPSRGFSFARRTGKVHRRASYGTHDLYRGRSHCGEAHMKSTWTANWTDRITEPAAAAAGAIFIVSLATLAGAWFFEYVVKIAPCRLCRDRHRRLLRCRARYLSLRRGMALVARPRRLFGPAH